MISELKSIEKRIAENCWKGRLGRLWGGAGVIISFKPLQSPVDDSWYSHNDLVLVTKHAREASALMTELRDAASDWLDYLNKFAYFGMITEAAIAYVEHAGDLKGLLLAMVREAIAVEKKTTYKPYFAYGSNMDAEQMAYRCPDALLRGKATLKGYAFALDSKGFATVVEKDGSSVEGLFWQISPSDEKMLDSYEGVGNCCYRKELLVINSDVGSGEALVYVSNRETDYNPHPSDYLNRVIQAAKEQGLTARHIAQIEAFNK